MIAKSIKAIYPRATWYEEFISWVKEVKREDDAEFFTKADALMRKRWRGTNWSNEIGRGSRHITRQTAMIEMSGEYVFDNKISS